MPTPSSAIIQLISVFAIAFTVPSFAKAQTLLWGTILAPGRRTVASAWRAMGLADEKHFTNYHRLLNRDHWSPWVLSHLLLILIVCTLLPPNAPLILIIDETLERRRGNQIKYKSWFRDPVRSTARHVIHALGIRWICLAIVIPVPWSHRPWALPFMVVPALSEATSAKLHKPHRSVVGWAMLMLEKVRRWQPQREITLIADGTYAAIALVQKCQRFKRPIPLVSRLRIDAKLHDFPAPQPKGKAGPKPKKGARQTRLALQLDDPKTRWRKITVPWYGNIPKVLEYVSGISLWAKRGEIPVPIRWVMVRCRDDKSFKPEVFFSSASNVSVQQILRWVIARWNIEVTFEELRAHLGFETQRQWSERAIERTTPCLFGIFSVVVVMAKVLYPTTLPVRATAWYPKRETTFSDVLAAVRRHLWQSGNCNTSARNHDPLRIHRATYSSLLEIACYST
jgi:hypothetical protein